MCTIPDGSLARSDCGSLSAARSPLEAPPLPWLTNAQDLLNWVLRDKLPNDNQRRNEVAAIRWLGKVDERPLAAISLDPRLLVDDRFSLIRRHRTLTRQRRSNIITLLNRVLRRAGILAVGARRGGITSHAWTNLIRLLPTLNAQASLSSFSKFCSARGVEPEGVTLAVWQAYVDETLNTSGVKHPRLKIQRTSKTSNAARLTMPDWPLPKLPGLPNPRTISMSKDVFPRSFWADLDTYAHMSSTPAKNIFDGDWPKRLSEATLHRYRHVAWRTASAEIHAGRSASEITSLAALLDVVWLQRAMTWLYQRAGNTFLKDHLNIAATWVSMADNYVHAPDEVIGRIRDSIKKPIERQLGPGKFSKKNTVRLFQFSDPAAVESLLILPYRIMAEIKAKKVIEIRDATDMMAAVAIELLLATMIRIKNLANLDIERNLASSSYVWRCMVVVDRPK